MRSLRAYCFGVSAALKPRGTLEYTMNTEILFAEINRELALAFLHDAIVAEVMTEYAMDYFPSVGQWV